MNNIIQLLKLSESKYNNLLFDFAVKYAETYMSHKLPETISSKVYWKWFTVQFEATNRRFYHTADTRKSLQELRVQWYKMHEPISTIVTPSDYVIDNILNYAKTKY